MKTSEIAVKRMVKCSECEEMFDPENQESLAPRVLNIGTERTLNSGTGHKRIVCDACFDMLWCMRYIIACANCGEWYDNSEISSFSLGDDTFAPCPNCHHDIVEGDTQEERLENFE